MKKCLRAKGVAFEDVRWPVIGQCDFEICFQNSLFWKAQICHFAENEANSDSEISFMFMNFESRIKGRYIWESRRQDNTGVTLTWTKSNLIELYLFRVSV